MLGHVGIPNAKARARDYPHQYSGGMRQRAMIAMALVHNPSILIADEPTTALDVTVQAQILELIEEVKREFDIGVILVTHDLGVVAETANSVMVMYAGRDHGVRAGRADLRAAAAPVRVGAARLDADDRAPPDLAGADRGLAAVAAQPADRLSVPSALRVPRSRPARPSGRRSSHPCPRLIPTPATCRGRRRSSWVGSAQSQRSSERTQREHTRRRADEPPVPMPTSGRPTTSSSWST